jgi:hypothetical protein
LEPNTNTTVPDAVLTIVLHRHGCLRSPNDPGLTLKQLLFSKLSSLFIKIRCSILNKNIWTVQWKLQKIKCENEKRVIVFLQERKKEMTDYFSIIFFVFFATICRVVIPVWNEFFFLETPSPQLNILSPPQISGSDYQVFLAIVCEISPKTDKFEKRLVRKQISPKTDCSNSKTKIIFLDENC